MGNGRIKFSSVDSLLQEARYDKAFATMVESLTCIKLFARVRESIEIALLMDFMNGLRKVSSKHLVVKSKKLLNTTLLEQISINYEVNINEENTGSTNSR